MAVFQMFLLPVASLGAMQGSYKMYKVGPAASGSTLFSMPRIPPAAASQSSSTLRIGRPWPLSMPSLL